MSAPAVLPAGAGDLPLLAALHRGCFPEEPWDEPALAGLLATPGTLALRLDGPSPCGFLLARCAADECEVLALGVLAPARRHGHGRCLIEALCARVAALGVRQVFLEVAVDNPAALACYRRCGFRQVGRRAGYYRRAGGRRVDALLLARAVGRAGR